MTNEDFQVSRRDELLAIAKAILEGEIGVIRGLRLVQSFRFDLADELDPDFMTFVGVDSDTDHLPVDDERENWSQEALDRKDVEIAEAQAFHREKVFQACRHLINRFHIS